MKHLFKLFCLMAFLCVGINAYADKMRSSMNLQYDIVSAGVVGAQGTVLCQVSVYSRNGKTSADDFKRAAVHGIIFKGMPGGNGVATQRPMSNPSVEYQKADFFNTFFADNGPYRAYANMEPTSVSRVKVGKQYRATAIVSVSKDELRRYLEQAGVVQGLGSIF